LVLHPTSGTVYNRIMGKTLGTLLLMCAFCAIPAHARTTKAKLTQASAHEINEALVKTPAADETCFAPDEPCDTKLIKFVQSAQKSLDVAIFDVNLDKLVHEIIVQSKKLPVRVVVDRKEAKGGDKGTLVPLLLKAGVTVKYGHQRGIMHDKFVIVDGKVIETGSFNYTNGAAFKNNENQVYLATPSIVTRYQNRFEKLWAEGQIVK
jgi:phosphatidylserine/phosphatidylglycerophosphate/cardiolipin synthase-like enzyme